MAKERRYKYHGMISIRDKLLGNSIQVNIGCEGDNRGDLITYIDQHLKESLRHIVKDRDIYIEKNRQLTEKEIDDAVCHFRKDRQWSNRRIINHFAKFGIDIDLEKEKIVRKKKLKEGQKELI